jgi:hypothetical protein
MALGALPAEEAVEQDGRPDAEEADSVSQASVEAVVPGASPEDGPVVPAWFAGFPVDVCSADEYSGSGAVVPEWDPAVCWLRVAEPVGLRDCPAELSDCPVGPDGSPAEADDSPGSPDATRFHGYCPERLVVAARSVVVVRLRVRSRSRRSEALCRDYFRERLVAELHGCSLAQADFLELQGARHWDYCYYPAHRGGRFHDCFRLPDDYPELRAVAPPHDHFLLPDDCYLDYQDAARRGYCYPAHLGARSRGCCRLPDGYPELRIVGPHHDHFPLVADCCLERRDATQLDCCPVRPVVRHPGYCLSRQDAVHPRSDPARCRFHVRLVVEVAPAQGVQREPS